jgi:hypothetical protein
MTTFENTQQPGSDPVGTTLAELKAAGHEFCVNSRWEPMVRVHSDCHQMYWPANSERIRDLVVVAFYEWNHRPISHTEFTQFMAELREECRAGGRRVSEDESARAEENAIVQGVLHVLNCDACYVGRTADLLLVLHTLQAERRITDVDRLPVLVNVFSKKLKRLIPVLRGLQIHAEIIHREDGSHCVLRRLEGFEDESPTASLPAGPTDGPDDNEQMGASVVNTYAGTDLGLADATDGNLRFD